MGYARARAVRRAGRLARRIRCATPPFNRVERHVRPVIADLEPLMQARGIGALIVPMHEAIHPSFRWITRGAKVTRGYAIKVAGRDPLLVSYPMERGEASATGLRTALVHDFGYDQIFRSAGNQSAAYAELFDRILRAEHATGSIAFCGNLPFHIYL